MTKEARSTNKWQACWLVIWSFGNSLVIRISKLVIPYEFQLSPRLACFSGDVRGFISAGAFSMPERVPQTGAVILASNHASFSIRRWSARACTADQLSRARKSVPVSGHRRAVAFVELRAGGPRRRRRGGIEGHSRPVARRRRHHFVSRRHADARRPVAARAFRHRADGDQVRRAGRAGADVSERSRLTGGITNFRARTAWR